MDFPYTKGIIRPNAQRLSLSLSPLVAQRSLLFRVQTDLRVKADYSQLSSSDISSTLWTMSAIPSNVAMSTGNRPRSSAVSTSSVYSQDSWKSPPPPINSDVRRHAMAFSPSVEWEEQKPDEELTLTTPVQSAHPVDHSTNSASGSDLPTPDEDSLASEYNKWKVAKEQEGGRKKLKKVHPTTPKRASRSSKAIGKVLARLSIQPSAKRAAKRQSIPALSPILQLPEVQTLPIHIPIPASLSSRPTSEQLALPLSSHKPPNRLSLSTTPPKQAREASKDDFKLHPAPLSRRIHKRYPSSPAILGWNPKNLPTAPVPELPAHILESTAPRSRGHSIAGGNSSPTPPLPVHVPDQDHNPIDRLRQLRSEIALSKLNRLWVSTTPPKQLTEANFKLEPAPPHRRVHKRYPSSPAIMGWNPKNLPTVPVPKLPAHILKSTAARSHCTRRDSVPMPLLPVHVSEQDHNPINRLRQGRSEVTPSKTALSQKRTTLHNPSLYTSSFSKTDGPPLPDGPMPIRPRSRSVRHRKSDPTLPRAL